MRWVHALIDHGGGSVRATARLPVAWRLASMQQGSSPQALRKEEEVDAVITDGENGWSRERNGGRWWW
jgi:hypothetical protein